MISTHAARRPILSVAAIRADLARRWRDAPIRTTEFWRFFPMPIVLLVVPGHTLILSSLFADLRHETAAEATEDRLRRLVHVAEYGDRLITAVQGAAALVSLPEQDVVRTSGLRPRLVLDPAEPSVSPTRDTTMVWGTASGPLLELDKPALNDTPWGQVIGEVSARRITIRSRIPEQTCRDTLILTQPPPPSPDITLTLRVRPLNGEWNSIAPNALDLISVSPGQAERLCQGGADLEWTVLRPRN